MRSPRSVRDARRVTQAGIDGLCWVVAIGFATWTRYDFSPLPNGWSAVASIALIAAGLQVLAGFLLSLYRGRYKYGSFDEVYGVVLAVGLAWIALFVALSIQPTRPVPIGAIALAGPLALCSMLGFRFLMRVMRRRSNSRDGLSQPVLLFGAGEAAEQLIRSMQSDRTTRYWPVGMLDDNPAKRRLRISGVPVLGTRASMGEAAARTGANVLIVAIASAKGTLLRELLEEANRAGMTMKVVPTVAELLLGHIGVGDVRDVDEADLLGRQQIDTDINALANFIHDRRVLITGAGGSIGSQLAVQIHRLGPAQLGLLDRDESALHAVELEIHGRGLLVDENMILADIRDAGRMREIFHRFQPEIVFHAAALKHLPLLEQYPAEAVKSNVIGTLNVLEAAEESGVDVFVNISTDKAANPSSVLGYTKRVTERLTAGFAESTGHRYLSVRFGNVLGSRGSVLTSFRAQIAAGGPVTVTHPEVTRFFMTIPEAVQLVIQAAVVGDGDDVLVLDMGEPVKIVNVARQMIEQSGKHVEIQFTGLRPGEKLHEDLFGDDETEVTRVHPLISAVPVLPITPHTARSINVNAEPQVVVNGLHDAVIAGGVKLPGPRARL